MPVLDFSELPGDCLLSILSNLQPKCLVSCRQVKKSWKRLAEVILAKSHRFCWILVRGQSVHYRFCFWNQTVSDQNLVESGLQNVDKLLVGLRNHGSFVRNVELRIQGYGKVAQTVFGALIAECRYLDAFLLQTNVAFQDVSKDLTSLMSAQVTPCTIAVKLIPTCGMGLVHFIKSIVVSKMSICDDFDEHDWAQICRQIQMTDLEISSSNTALTDFECGGLVNLKNLTLRQTVGFFFDYPEGPKTLTLIQCCEIYAEDVSRIFSKLKSLDIRDCSLITSTALGKHVESFHNLKYFRFRGGGWDFRWTMSKLTLEVLETCFETLQGLNVAAVSGTNEEDALLFLKSAEKTLLNGPVDQPLVLDLGLNSTDIDDFGDRVARSLGSVNVTVQKFTGMQQCNRIWLRTPEKRPVAILSDLSSVRESFWSRFLNSV